MTQAEIDAAALRRAEAIAIFALFVGAVAIGFAPIFAKLAMKHGEVGPSAAAFWRVTFALPVFYVFLLAHQYQRRCADRRRQSLAPEALIGPDDLTRRMPWRQLGWLLLPGVLFAGDLALWHLALQYTSAANSTLLANLQAVIVGVVGWVFLKERLKGIFPIGAALALVGVLLLLRAGPAEVEPGRNPLVGDLLSIVVAAFYASYILSIKHLRRRYGVLSIMTIASAVSAVCLLIIAVLSGEQLLSSTLEGWLALIALGLVAHCLGQGLIAFALAKLPASFSAVSLLVQPVAAAIWGWILLAEALTILQMLAGLIVLAGIALARLGSR